MSLFEQVWNALPKGYKDVAVMRVSDTTTYVEWRPTCAVTRNKPTVVVTFAGNDAWLYTEFTSVVLESCRMRKPESVVKAICEVLSEVYE